MEVLSRVGKNWKTKFMRKRKLLLASLFTMAVLPANVHRGQTFPIATNGVTSQAGVFAAFGGSKYLVGDSLLLGFVVAWPPGGCG